jgi:hypothetical protein
MNSDEEKGRGKAAKQVFAMLLLVSLVSAFIFVYPCCPIAFVPSFPFHSSPVSPASLLVL